MADSDSIKLCECGCGLPAPIAKTTDKRGYGTVKGQPLRFIRGHNPNGCKTHGRSGTREFEIWMGMLNRCRNPNNHKWPWYGGRGIAVCDRWNKFENFLADMGECPSPQHSLDRYPDNDGDYAPGNVRWATAPEQSINTRRNVFLTAFGRTLTISQWALEFGVKRHTIAFRIRYGWSAERAVSTPAMKGRNQFTDARRSPPKTSR